MILRNQCCCKFAEDMATILLLTFSQVFPLANFKTIWLVGNLTCFLPNDPLVFVYRLCADPAPGVEAVQTVHEERHHGRH